MIIEFIYIKNNNDLELGGEVYQFPRRSAPILIGNATVPKPSGASGSSGEFLF